MPRLIRKHRATVTKPLFRTVEPTDNSTLLQRETVAVVTKLISMYVNIAVMPFCKTSCILNILRQWIIVVITFGATTLLESWPPSDSR
jgi:hypothetical protein